MEFNNEEIEFIIESLTNTANKSVELTNSFNNPVYNKSLTLIEKLKGLLVYPEC